MSRRRPWNEVLRTAIKGWLFAALGLAVALPSSSAPPKGKESEIACLHSNITSRYVSILQGLEEFPEQAVDDLAELYLCADRADIKNSFVTRRFISVAKAVVTTQSASCISAIVALHQDAFFSSHSRRWDSLAPLAKERSKLLVELQLESRKSQEHHPSLARLIGRLALKERDAGRLLEARTGLKQAINLDPRNLGLIQALSTLEEKLGYFSAAEKGFALWSELAPSDPEPKLRQALAWKKMGRGS